MKKYLILLTVLAYQLTLFAQQHTTNPLLAAKKKLDINHPSYNPEKAFAGFSELAQQGNGTAMNALGMLYMQGLGVTQDDRQAVTWFEKAAHAGYGKAWFNWATMYKNGDGVAQDFKKALDILKQGAEKGFAACIYGAGFMLYKGLGCQQDYAQAIKYFKQGAATNKSPGSMHMLGLCYRNGYGTAVNTDSARYWLSRAYLKGYGKSGFELSVAEGENPETALTETRTRTGYQKNAAVQAATGKEKQTFAKVLHQSPRQNISGTYKGYIIRYDWSGKHIISKSELKLQLSHAGDGTLNGQWTEADTLTAAIQAVFTDSALVFNNTQYQRTDHYNRRKPLSYQFKDARLQVVESADSVFIAGNLQLWSVKKREPERPLYISLVRQTDGASLKNIAAAETKNTQNGLLVYPNPFESTVNAEFFLTNAATVDIQLADMNGRTLYRKSISLPAGQQRHAIEANLLPAAYLLRLSWRGTEKTAIVIKK